MYIKLYVSEEEKAKLEAIAKKRNIALSRLCYEQVVPLLHNPLSDAAITKSDQTVPENCTKIVSLHLTDSEYASLVKRAKGTPLSRYLRRTLLNNYEPIRIEIYTEDISALTMKVSAYIDQLHNFIAGLAIRRQLYETDYERLIQIANDTKIALRDAANYAKANRSSIRASGVRILRKEIQKAVEKLLGGLMYDRYLQNHFNS